MAAGDFISFYEAAGVPFEIALDPGDMADMRRYYAGHSYNDRYLRPGEPDVLIHSTPAESWESIRRDGMLKSWNLLKAEGTLREHEPVGAALGDPEDFRDYIMFGSGVTGELIVSSRQKGAVCMDASESYLTGARLYFNASRMARDGLLLRDGCHMKVKDSLPLEPYLIWAADWVHCRSRARPRRSSHGGWTGCSPKSFIRRLAHGIITRTLQNRPRALQLPHHGAQLRRGTL